MAASAVLFGVFTAVFGMVAESQQIHAFHNAVVASLLLVLSTPPAIAIARKPDHPVAALQILLALSAAAVVTMAASATIDPFTLPFVLLTGVLWILRPSEQPSTGDERPSWMLLGLVAVGVVPLLAYALGEAQLQRTLTDSHAQFFHWVEASFYAVGVLAIALLAALRPLMYRMAAWSAGVGVIILGSASLMLNSYASAVPMPWPWLAIAGGVAFIGVAEWEVDRHAEHGLTATWDLPSTRTRQPTPGTRGPPNQPEPSATEKESANACKPVADPVRCEAPGDAEPGVGHGRPAVAARRGLPAPRRRRRRALLRLRRRRPSGR